MKNITRVQLKLINLLRDNTMGVSLTLVLFGCIAIIFQVGNRYTGLFLLLDCGILILSFILPFFFRLVLFSFSSLAEILGKFTNLPEGIAKRFRISNSTTAFMLTGGVILLGGGVVTINTLGLPWDGIARTLFETWLCFILFGYGGIAGLYVYHFRLLFSLNQVQVNCSPFNWPRAEIMQIYRIYSRLLVTGTNMYILGVVSIWTAPGNWLIGIAQSVAANQGVLINLNLPWRLIESLWVFPTAFCIIFFFLVFNFSCHEFLVQCQTKSLEYLSNLADKALAEWERKPNAERQNQVDKILEWREQIKRERVWPFELKAFWAVITSTILPIIQLYINTVIG